MKTTMVKVISFAALVVMSMAAAEAAQKDHTITKVVKILEAMLDKSVKEGDEETKIFAKFKCYCDQNEASKTASIKKLTDEIQVLESKISELQGSTGVLSSECADLKARMAANEKARDDATAMRKKENKAFLAEESDLNLAIKNMKNAIEVLTKVGADQTKGAGADSKQFMAGQKASLLSLDQEVQHALRAATALMNPAQQSSTVAFLQAPFTGTYTSQSGQVMGIIKNMRDTFISNLEDAKKTEKDSKEAYDKFTDMKEAAFKEMKASYEEKQKGLGGNDDSLASKKKQLAESEKGKASDEEFLNKLLPMCKEKAKGFENRKMLRANEEAAISEAISILNSDEAFATFGTVDATKTGATGPSRPPLNFVQIRSVREHLSGDANARRLAQNMLQEAAIDAKSAKLSKVVALLQAENPFDGVLGEIDKMLGVISDEGKEDKEKLDWCNKERKDNHDSLKKRKAEILALEKKLDSLKTAIEDPKTGLKAQIAETEQDLLNNKASQTKETATRAEENQAYQKDIKNLVAAQSILSKALKVLKTYYADLEAKLAAGTAFLQEDPKPPEAWAGDGAYGGQKSQGGDVMDMLKFILKESKAEETEAHKNEEKAQHDYEDSMTKLKKQEADAEKSLAKLQQTLAEKEEHLLNAQEDLKTTNEDKDSIEAYLSKIKPGCDFITKNFDLREKNRDTEKKALTKAIGLIKATPAYTKAKNR